MDKDLIRCTTDIVVAVIIATQGSVNVSIDVCELFLNVHRTVIDTYAGKDYMGPPTPAVPIEESISDAFIVCLEDGLKFKSLRRHLMTKYNMTPSEYRDRWKLPPDYPMVAPEYGKRRSELAKDMGLGRDLKVKKFRKKKPAPDPIPNLYKGL